MKRRKDDGGQDTQLSNSEKVLISTKFSSSSLLLNYEEKLIWLVVYILVLYSRDWVEGQSPKWVSRINILSTSGYKWVKSINKWHDTHFKIWYI